MERLLYVLNRSASQVKIDICKGRINAAGNRARQIHPPR